MKSIESLAPVSETAYYILISLTEENHGYGIMQEVDNMTRGRIRLGPGTVYGTLSKMVKQKLITVINETERKKTYRINERGRELLKSEITRINELSKNGETVWNKL